MITILLQHNKSMLSFFFFSYLMGLVLMAGTNFVLTLVAALLCVFFAPTAAGPGIPEIKAYLNGVDTPNMFGASTLIVKVGSRLDSVMTNHRQKS